MRSASQHSAAVRRPTNPGLDTHRAMIANVLNGCYRCTFKREWRARSWSIAQTSLAQRHGSAATGRFIAADVLQWRCSGEVRWIDRSDAAVWCSGLTRCPVKAEIGGSNPLTVANRIRTGPAPCRAFCSHTPAWRDGLWRHRGRVAPPLTQVEPAPRP